MNRFNFKWIFLLPLFILCVACEQKNHHKKSEDFNTLMGANKSVWKFVETHEDFKNIRFFQDLYEKNKELLAGKEDGIKIPQTIHFVWLGPNPFPKESLENVRSWVEFHPNWTFKLWTDRRRPLPHPRMELKLVSDFKFSRLRDCFDDSDNYAEKADVLRYEILSHEGGLYVDHDVKCFKPFDQFHYNYDLYCGLEPPHKPIMSSSISVNNNLIGSRPHHPVLDKCMDLVLERWIDIGNAYPGEDKESIIYRVAQRSFAPFDDAMKLVSEEGDTTNIVFPAAYFNRIDDDFALYAHHYYASTWFEDETKFERNVRRRLVAISRKNNQILLFNAVILSANLVLFGCLLFQYRVIRRVTGKTEK